VKCAEIIEVSQEGAGHCRPTRAGMLTRDGDAVRPWLGLSRRKGTPRKMLIWILSGPNWCQPLQGM
jgi:hypothetical protein